MSRINNQEGFSLIELLIALLILTLVITAFTALFTHSFQNIFSAGHKSVAQHIGQDAMESLLTDLESTHPDATVQKDSMILEIEFSGQTIKTNGTQVTVTAPYTDARGETRTQIFKAFIPD
jgi:prepilin-type N-terminal cleavage/methylation domain-containing protein